MLAVTLVSYPAIHASGIYCIKNANIGETGCSCVHSHLTYVNNSVYLPANAHILYSQIKHASVINISKGNGLGWNQDNTVMYYVNSFPGRFTQLTTTSKKGQ